MGAFRTREHRTGNGEVVVVVVTGRPPTVIAANCPSAAKRDRFTGSRCRRPSRAVGNEEARVRGVLPKLLADPRNHTRPLLRVDDEFEYDLARGTEGVCATHNV